MFKTKAFLITFTTLLFSFDSFSINITLYPTEDVCNQSLGSIISNVTGGVPPYIYLWSNNATTADIQNITAGTYTLTVYDSAGDSATKSAIVIGYSNIPLSMLYSEVAQKYPCFNQCNGVIVLPTNNVTPAYFWGTPPHIFTTSQGNLNYTSQYLNGNPGVGIENICGGVDVTVTVTDATGCTGQTIMNLVNMPNVTNPVISTAPSCNSLQNGSVTIDNVPQSFWLDRSINITNNTISNCNSNNFNLPHTFINLQTGNYYLQVCYPYFTIDGCPQYFPFTITDLGTNCSTVDGNVFVDLNSDCVMDSGEVGVPNAIIEFTPGPYYAITNSSGNYTTNLPWGSYNLSQFTPNNLTQICPASPYPVTLNSSNPNVIVNFADSSNILLDVETSVSSGPTRPGFDFNYSIQVKNLSHYPSGPITITLDYDTVLSFVSANPLPSSILNGQITWTVNSISNFMSTGTFTTFNVPPNPGLIGDTLFVSVNAQASNPELNLLNNSVTKYSIITGSYDPNEKNVIPEGNFLPALNNVIDYTIQFQNTGNDTAFSVVIIDTLDANLDVSTFVPGAASHPYETELSGHGIVKFIFNNILLPDSIVDEPNSHGFVSFKIKIKDNLPHNTIVKNEADIYFDFNPPITTAEVISTVDYTLAINTSSTQICEGQPLTLSIIPELINSSNTWIWYKNNCTGSMIGTGDSITIYPTSSAVYFVKDSAGVINSVYCFEKSITVLPASNTTQNIFICYGDSIIVGTSTYINTGIYTDIFIASNGCDSIVTTELTVNPPIDTTLTGIDFIISSNALNGTYQWVDCNNNYAPVPGETSQSFSPLMDGNYAVIISDNGCVDTSECVLVIGIAIQENNQNANIIIYPNPTTGIITLQSNSTQEKTITVESITGKVIFTKITSAENIEISLSEYSKGIYIIKVIEGEKIIYKKLSYY